MSEEYVLQLQHIRKEYPGVVALKDVTLELGPGEILALIGENGAGKSTLIKCCSGAVIPTSGKIIVNGREFSSMTPQLAAENGIAIIYQEFNNVKELSAAENLFLGRPIRKGIIVDKKAMEEEAAKARESARSLFSGGGNAAEMPTCILEEGDFQDGAIDILAVLVKSGLTASRSEARRAVEQGGVTVDGEKVSDIKALYRPEQFDGEGIVVRRGKKNYKRVTRD